MFKEREVVTKENTEIREMNIRSEPGNAALLTIKIRFWPLDNPKLVLGVLKGMASIKRYLVGNNITTGKTSTPFTGSASQVRISQS